MKKTRLFVFILVLICTFVPYHVVCDEPVHFTDEGNPEELAQKIAQSMNPKELLGQVLMFGYSGEQADANILKWIAEHNLGGVKIFGQNANDLNALVTAITAYQKTALSTRFGIPLLISTDQEGGKVRHVKGNTSITPGNMALGADPLVGDALEVGRIIGRELAQVGVNMNFAPTVDVFVNPQSEVIGSRAFSSDPHRTGILGIAFAKGQEEYGVISTAKHFPGHGDTKDDSHAILPVVPADMDILHKRDLIPYKMMMRSGLPSIMVGHLAFPAITNNETPATLSKLLIGDLLRNELKFEGVIITDDLFMQGARANGISIAEACYRSIIAGTDILLVSQGNTRTYRSILDRLLGEIKNKEAFKERVEESAIRVIKMKLEWLKKDNSVPYFPESPVKNMNNLQVRDFLFNQAARSITLIRNKRFPIRAEDAGTVLLVATMSGFLNEGEKRYPGAEKWTIQYSDTKSALRQQGRELRRIASAYDTVIVLLSGSDMAILLNELEDIAPRVVVVSVLSPAPLNELQWAQTTLAAYGTGLASFRAVFAALSGDFIPQGMLPIPLEMKH